MRRSCPLGRFLTFVPYGRGKHRHPGHGGRLATAGWDDTGPLAGRCRVAVGPLPAKTNGGYSMHSLTVWLLVVDALVTAAMHAHGGFRPLVPAPTVVRATRTRSRPTLSDRNRSR